MYLKAEEVSSISILLLDGDGNEIKNCIDIDTKTGNAFVFIDFDKPNEWPADWRFGQFLGTGGGMKVMATFKLPITVILRDAGIAVEDELQLLAAARFETLGRRIDRKATENKNRIDDAFINLWAELGMAKAGIR